MEARGAGITVVSSEARFTHTSPGPGVRTTRVLHRTSGTALTVDDLSCWLGLAVVVTGIGGEGVALGEVHEALCAGVAAVPGVVWFAVAPARQVLTSTIRKLRLTHTP